MLNMVGCRLFNMGTNMKIHIRRKGYFRAKFFNIPSTLILPRQFHPRLRWTQLAEMSDVWESLSYVAPPTSRQDRIAL